MKVLQSVVICFLIFLSFVFSSCCIQKKVKENLLDLDTFRYRKKHNEKFFESVKDGDLQGVQEALDGRKADVNSSDRLRQSALMWAAWTGREEIFQHILQFNDDLNSKKIWRKGRPFLKYAQESKSKYNPLFCLIASDNMSSQHAKECVKNLLDSEKKWTKKNKLLYKVDSFRENVLHKAARKGDASIMQFLITTITEAELAKGVKFVSLLEGKNKEGDTPLIVAIKSRNPEIVRMLIRNGADMSVKVKIGKKDRSLGLLAFDDGRGDYYTFLEVLKGILYHCRDEEEQGIAETKKKYKREDEELAAEIMKYRERLYGGEIIGEPFSTSYVRLAKDKVATEEELEDQNYKSIVNAFFSLLRKSNLSYSEIDDLRERIKTSPFLLTQKHRNEEYNIEESALEIAIKNGNYDAFRIIFDLSDMSRLPKVSLGYTDYFICAIVHGEEKIIKHLLKYSNERGVGAVSPELMSAGHKHFAGDKVFNNKTNAPVVAFLKNEALRSNTELLHKVLLYYKDQYSAGLANPILQEVLTYDDEKFILSLYNYSREKEGFYRVSKVKDTGLPLVFYYLETGYYEALKKYLRGTPLTSENLNYIFDTRKEDRQNFFEVLADTLKEKPDNPELNSIKELVKEVFLYEF